MVHALQSEAEQRQRAAALARMQRLPDGVTAVSAPSSGTACHVCGEEDEADDNVLLQVMGSWHYWPHWPHCHPLCLDRLLPVEATSNYLLCGTRGV